MVIKQMKFEFWLALRIIERFSCSSNKCESHIVTLQGLYLSSITVQNVLFEDFVRNPDLYICVKASIFDDQNSFSIIAVPFDLSFSREDFKFRLWLIENNNLRPSR